MLIDDFHASKTILKGRKNDKGAYVLVYINLNPDIGMKIFHRGSVIARLIPSVDIGQARHD